MIRVNETLHALKLSQLHRTLKEEITLKLSRGAGGSSSTPGSVTDLSQKRFMAHELPRLAHGFNKLRKVPSNPSSWTPLFS